MKDRGPSRMLTQDRDALSRVLVHRKAPTNLTEILKAKDPLHLLRLRGTSRTRPSWLISKQRSYYSFA